MFGTIPLVADGDESTPPPPELRIDSTKMLEQENKPDAPVMVRAVSVLCSK